MTLSRSRAGTIVCDVGSLTDLDFGTVDALARLELAARRLGRRLRLVRASPELRELLGLAGLQDVVRCAEPLRLEARGQAKGREEASGVEEERDPADTTP